MTDPIVDEVRRGRDAHAASFNYDLDAIFLDIKEQERASGLEFVTYPPRAVGLGGLRHMPQPAETETPDAGRKVRV